MPFVAAPQSAVPEAPCPACLTYYRNPEGKTNLLEDVSLDREERVRTILLNTANYNQLYLVIFYTYSTATELSVQLSCSADDKEFTVRSVDKLDTEGRNQRYLLSYAVSGCSSTRVVFGGSADANGSDVVTVQAVGQLTGDSPPVQ